MSRLIGIHNKGEISEIDLFFENGHERVVTFPYMTQWSLSSCRHMRDLLKICETSIFVIICCQTHLTPLNKKVV